MAAIVTGTTTGFVDTTGADEQFATLRQEIATDTAFIRREQAQDVGTLRRELAIDTGTLRRETSEDSGTIRREAENYAGDIKFKIKENSNEVIKEGLKSAAISDQTTNAARYDLALQGVQNSDRVMAQGTANFNLTTQAAFSNAKDLSSLLASSDLNAQKAASDIEKAQDYIAAQSALATNVLGSAMALGQNILERATYAEGSATRALINDLKVQDLNRLLIERNAEVVEERACASHWRNTAQANQYGAQFAQLQSMMQNFQSQLATNSQGMNNFGTMAGPVGQTSTANNVR